jgi:hypothetical protein
MKLMDLKSNLNINEREIFIHKIFLSGKSSEKYYLVTYWYFNSSLSKRKLLSINRFIF